MNQTVFKDVRQRAKVVYRVKTRSSEYLIGIHEADGRRFAIVRGLPGTERENAVSRDSDPRVGGHSMFDLPLAEWPGKMLEVATMTTSPIVSAVVETDARAIQAVAIETLPGAAPPSSGAVAAQIVDPAREKHAQERSPWARPVKTHDSAPPPPSVQRAAGHAPPSAHPPMPAQPAQPVQPAQPAQVVQPPSSGHAGRAWSTPAGGLPENPRIVPQQSRGTHPAMAAAEIAAKWRAQGGGGAPTEVDMPAHVGPSSYAQAAVAQVSPIVQQVVLGQQAGGNPAEPTLPYPQRHVGYAESAAALLRSIGKRDRLFEDIAHDREMKERLRRALDDCAVLLEQIRRRDRK